MQVLIGFVNLKKLFWGIFVLIHIAPLLMDHSEATPNPIVFFASFLLFLSYFYHKVWEPRNKSPAEEKINEQYIVHDHSSSSPPHINTISPQSFENFFPVHVLHPQKAKKQTYNSDMKQDNLTDNRQKATSKPRIPGSAILQDETLSANGEGWPSHEHDLDLSDKLSAIPSARTPGPSLSLNNSLLDNPFAQNMRSNEMDDDFRSAPVINNNEIRNTKKPSQKDRVIHSKKKIVTTRKISRADSSDSDLERKDIIYEEEMEISTKKDGMVEEKVQKNKNARPYKGSSLNETDYEPQVTKKRQTHPIREDSPNSKVEPLAPMGIKIKEIINNRSKHHDSKPRKPNNDSTISNGELAKKKVKLDSKTDIGNKNAMLDDLEQKGKPKADSLLRKELKEKKFTLDSSYLNEIGKYSSNVRLKKFVAKKTVQEEAWRISDLPNVVDPGKLSMPSLSTTTPTTTLTGKDDAAGGSGLFKNASQAGSGDLFKTILPGNTNPTQEKKDSTLPKPQEERKTNAVIQDLLSKGDKKPEESAPQLSAQKSLFNNSGLFGPTISATEPALISKPSITVQPPVEEPKLTKNVSSINTAAPASTTTSQAIAGLFSNTQQTSVEPAKQAPMQGITPANNEAPKTDQTEKKPSLFGNLNQFSETSKSAENKGSGLFSNLNSTQPTINNDKKETNQTATNAPVNKTSEQPKSSIFSGGLFGNTGSSELFTQNKPTNNTNNQPAQSDQTKVSPTDNQTKPENKGLFTMLAQPSNQTPAASGGDQLGGGLGSGNLLNKITSEPKANTQGSIFQKLGQTGQSTPQKELTDSPQKSTLWGDNAGAKPAGIFASSGWTNTNTGTSNSANGTLFGNSTNSNPISTNTNTGGPKTGTIFGSLLNSVPSSKNTNIGASDPPSSGGLFGNLKNSTPTPEPASVNTTNSAGGKLFADLFKNTSGSMTSGSNSLFNKS